MSEMSVLLRYVPICLELKNLVKATRRKRRVILITKYLFQNVRFVMIFNLIMSVPYAIIPLLEQKKGGQNDYIK